MQDIPDGARQLEAAQAALAGRLAGVDPVDLPGLRQAYDAFSEDDPLPPLAVDSEIILGGVNCHGLMPRGGSGNRVLLWMHGGGFNLGSSRSHRGVAGQTASAGRCTAIVVNYRRSPEHKHPAALEDGLAAWRGLVEEGVDPGRIILAGDSAGGFLALAMALRIRSEGGLQPGGLMLLSPWIDLANSGWSHRALAGRDRLLTRAGLDARAKLYLGEVVPGEEGTGLLEADLSGLPPVMIQVGQSDILLSDSTTLAERLGAAGSPVTLEVWPGMFHVFQARYAVLQQAQQAVTRLGHWASAHFKP